MKESKISVIVPVYNIEKYIVKTVESIRNQTHKNLEIILVDDGSSDGKYCAVRRLDANRHKGQPV